MPPYAIFINTTDAFEDCWNPFFILFKKYWPNYGGKIYLNTETKDFMYSGLQISSIKNGLMGRSWSDCLQAGLMRVTEENILYMQEDYFLRASVNRSMLNKMYKLFIENRLDCLHLTDQSTMGPFEKNTFNPLVWEILIGAEYRISTQAAFWDKESLINFIEPGLSGWEFEQKANKNIALQPKKIYCANKQIVQKNKNEIIPYVFTGIIKGKWKREVQRIFNSNNINVDFEIRGFYSNYSIIRYLTKFIKP